MSEYMILHNPRCSKSRKALEILREKGIEPIVCEYLKDPPDVSTLKSIIKKLNEPMQSLLRKKEAVFSELNIDLNDEAAILAALESHPILIERPVVVSKTKAVIARPPEKVSELWVE